VVRQVYLVVLLGTFPLLEEILRAAGGGVTGCLEGREEGDEVLARQAVPTLYLLQECCVHSELGKDVRLFYDAADSRLNSDVVVSG